MDPPVFGGLASIPHRLGDERSIGR